MESTTNIAKKIIRKREGLERENPTYELDPIKDVPEVWQLKHTQIKKLKFPYMDSPPIKPYIEKTHTEQSLAVTERRVNHKRKELVGRKQYIESQWKDLELKEKALKENFIVFSKFMKTNLEKRERAAKKLKSDVEIVQKRIEDVDILRKKYDVKSYQLQLMKNEILKHSKYQLYLQRVTDLSDGKFKDKDDILKRMECLLLIREKLYASSDNQLSFLECSERMMAQFMESKRLQILGLNNTIASLQYTYDEATSRTLKLDRLMIDLKSALINSAIDLTSTTHSIRGLYNLTYKMHGVKERHRVKNITDQLLHVNHSIKGYETVYGIMKRRRSRKGSKLNTQYE